MREHDSLVVGYNNSAAPYPADRTVVDLFVAQAARTPDAEAVRFGGRALTYHGLNERSNQIANHLCAIGVAPGQLVAVYMEHSIEVVCAILGVLKAGAAYVPLDPATPKDCVGLMLQDISEGSAGTVPVAITQSRLLPGIPSDLARLVVLDNDMASIADCAASEPGRGASPSGLAYVIYTSGSTGRPKGVMIEHRSLMNYIWWANQMYQQGEQLTWPLFSSLAFDLTVTSIYTPLTSGGRLVIYREDPGMHATVVFKVVEDGLVDIIKLTPAHLAMIKDTDLQKTRIRRLIVGGEDFKTDLARQITDKFVRPVEIYNEYGPTEATVGCMIHRFDRTTDVGLSVPIGRPAANTNIFILDEKREPTRAGVVGEMYIGGDGLARGYFNRPELTDGAFVGVNDPRRTVGDAQGAPLPTPARLYRTGDLARWSEDGRMEFLGRSDFQVKIGGFRIELGEIESQLRKHPDVGDCVVAVAATSSKPRSAGPVTHCARCGLASTLPGTTYDDTGVCNICRAFDSYVDRAEAYFKTPDELKGIVAEMKSARTGDYDCLVMLSGGKDSTYMLYQLCGLGLKPLVFTLDNGFISDEAKVNIRRTVAALGVDHVFGSTPHMNEIFVDSLNRFSNVCNGCFKTIYTLATNLALEKHIGYIVTGLSRGQFFETRLTEDVFRRKDFDVAKLDALVLEARKAYHQRQDAVSSVLEADVFRDEGVFESVRFVDFYRYWSVPLEEMYAFLDKNAAWVRPSDTGRSTNCLINDLGIYLHKKQRGFHNYSLPYSWDVRLGQKKRLEAMEELEDEIDEASVKRMMAQIGYREPEAPSETTIGRLVAYYVSDRLMSATELREYLGKELPTYMLPSHYVRLDALPLTPNGKIDCQALPAPSADDARHERELVAPRNDIERALAAIWTELLQVENIGINDEFFDLGGHSLLAIRAVSRIRDAFDVDLPLETMFANPTIAGLATVLAAAKGSIGKAPIKRLARPTRGGVTTS